MSLMIDAAGSSLRGYLILEAGMYVRYWEVGDRVIVLAFRLTTFRMHLKSAYMYSNSIISIIGRAHFSSINCTCPSPVNIQRFSTNR